MMSHNMYQNYGQGMQGFNSELFNQLYKEYELINTLHALYYKVMETNPGERFIRFAKKNRREKPTLVTERKISGHVFKEIEIKPLQPHKETESTDIDSHLKVALEFLKIKETVTINPNLLQLHELPIVNNVKKPEIEEENAKRTRRSSFKI
jgi:hypothetical protein